MILLASVGLILLTRTQGVAPAERPIILVTAHEIDKEERQAALYRKGNEVKLGDGTKIRLVKRPDYLLAIQDDLLPEGYVASLRRISAALRQLGDPLTPFDHHDPKRADLKDWIATSFLPESLDNAPNVRIIMQHSLQLQGAGRSVSYFLDNTPELSDKDRPAVFTRKPTVADRKFSKSMTWIPTGERHTYLLDPTVRFRDQLGFETDVARLLQEQWTKAVEGIRAERADLDRRFEEERQSRKRFEDPNVGDKLSDMSPDLRKTLESYIANNWEVLGFPTKEAGAEWLKTASVGRVKITPYALFGVREPGNLNGMSLGGLSWP